jgi:acyl-CoA thioesterase-1
MSAPTIVFIGDSITDAERRQTADGLGEGYVRELAARPELSGWTVVNRGIGGNRVVDLRARWQEDLLDLAPDAVSIFVGINEVWRRFDSDDPTSDADFAAGYRALLDTLHGVPVALVEPYLLPKDEEQRGWLGELDGKLAVVRALAAEYGAALVPAHVLLTEAGDAASLAPDGVHPNETGHRLLADTWLAHAGRILER